MPDGKNQKDSVESRLFNNNNPTFPYHTERKILHDRGIINPTNTITVSYGYLCVSIFAPRGPIWILDQPVIIGVSDNSDIMLAFGSTFAAWYNPSAVVLKQVTWCVNVSRYWAHV